MNTSNDPNSNTQTTPGASPTSIPAPAPELPAEARLAGATTGVQLDKTSREYFDTVYLRLDLPVDTIAWDYDNTLGKTEIPALTNLTKVLNEYLESIGSETRYNVATVIRDFKGRTCRDILHSLNTAGTPDEEIERLVVRELDLNIAEFKARMEVTEGTNEAVKICADMGMTQLVQSSSDIRRLHACLEGAGQAAFFGDRVYSAQSSLEYPQPKPDPAIVHHALKAVGKSSTTTIGVDDSSSGTGALVNANVFTIGFVGCEHTPEQKKELAKKLIATGAAVVVEDLRDVPKIIDLLNRSKNDPALKEQLATTYRDAWLS